MCRLSKSQKRLGENINNSDIISTMSYLALTEIIHLTTAIALFVPFSIFFGPLTASLALLGAFLIDVDHLFDYFLHLVKCEKTFSISDFLKVNFFEKTGKIIIPLHSWELSWVLIAIYFLTFQPIFLVIGVSISAHLAVDQLTNNVRIPAYFLLNRLINKFNKNAICRL